MGGHYYAYIRSFEDGKWYNFNDSSVTELDNANEAISKMFGGDSTSAYMLQYRKHEPKKAKEGFFSDSVSNELIPDYQMQEIVKEKTELLEKQETQLKSLLAIQLKIHEASDRDKYRMVVG